MWLFQKHSHHAETLPCSGTQVYYVPQWLVGTCDLRSSPIYYTCIKRLSLSVHHYDFIRSHFRSSTTPKPVISFYFCLHPCSEEYFSLVVLVVNRIKSKGKAKIYTEVKTKSFNVFSFFRWPLLKTRFPSFREISSNFLLFLWEESMRICLQRGRK